ncbi:hypothetical protein [Cloacibacterium sp.]|uniref:hypothetical protein n=1 Tax=Cloacibacterium sp. TaxID=1913682 RepID=UPI0039E29CED
MRKKDSAYFLTKRRFLRSIFLLSIFLFSFSKAQIYVKSDSILTITEGAYLIISSDSEIDNNQFKTSSVSKVFVSDEAIVYTSSNVDINEEISTKFSAAKQCYSKKTLTQRSKKDNKANEIKKITQNVNRYRFSFIDDTNLYFWLEAKLIISTRSLYSFNKDSAIFPFESKANILFFSSLLEKIVSRNFQSAYSLFKYSFSSRPPPFV